MSFLQWLEHSYHILVVLAQAWYLYILTYIIDCCRLPIKISALIPEGALAAIARLSSLTQRLRPAAFFSQEDQTCLELKSFYVLTNRLETKQIRT